MPTDWLMLSIVALMLAMSAVRVSGADNIGDNGADNAGDQTVDLIPTVNLVPAEYRHRLVQQLSLAEDNQQSWLRSIVAVKPEHREALVYLLINMPESDLKSLKGDYLLDNVELAYQAREATAWGRAIPREIFFREVLPYANLDETREDWRKRYFEQFLPLVKDAKTASDAAMILNKHVFPTIKVKYHATKRLKPNQSPAESTRIGYASCTGLSIILVDACRAVGVPARVAGVPLWNDKNGGNHTWTEVWDRQWYFVGAAEPGPLDQTWFVDNAARADPTRVETRIYAASFERTDTPFPMVWDVEKKDVSAEDVTRSYIARSMLRIGAPPDAHIEVRHKDVLVAAGVGPFSLPVGEAYSVSILDASGTVVETKTTTIGEHGTMVNFSGR